MPHLNAMSLSDESRNIMNTTFFCDECGNTGSDWLNSEQPLFVYGGWLIRDSIKANLISELNTITSSSLHTSQVSELKSVSFYKKNRVPLFRKIFNCFIENEAFPVFVIGEKRFLFSAKIIDTLFDSLYSNDISCNFSWDTEGKLKLAQILCSADECLNSGFSQLIKTGVTTLDEMRNICNKISDVFSSLGMVTVAKFILNLTNDSLLEMINEFCSDNSRRGLSIPILYQLITVLDRLCAVHDFNTVIKLDNIMGHREWFELLNTTLFRKESPKFIHFKNTTVQSNFNHVNSLILVDSKEEPLIQFSDILCGFINRAFKRLQKSCVLDADEVILLKSFLLMHDELHTWDFSLSDDLFYKYGEACFGESITKRQQDYKSLDDYFKSFIISLRE